MNRWRFIMSCAALGCFALSFVLIIACHVTGTVNMLQFSKYALFAWVVLLMNVHFGRHAWLRVRRQWQDRKENT